MTGTSGPVDKGERAVSRRVVLGEDSLLVIALLAYVTLVQISYFLLRDNDVWLYFATHISFDASRWPLVVAVSYIIVLPLIYLFCRRAESDLFALLLLPLVLIGGVSGAVALCFARDLAQAFFFICYFIALPALLSTVRIPAVAYPRIRMGRRGDGIFILAGLISLGLSAFWAWKYRAIIGFPGFADVYEYRHALDAIIAGWERYAMIFAKFVGGFSMAYVAVTSGKFKYLVASVAIFLVDYMIAGHRASIAFAGMIVAGYGWFVILQRRFHVSHIAIALALAVALFSAILLAVSRISPYVIAIYDRVFHVTAGLFLRYQSQAEDVGLYRGGDGLLGAVLGGNGQNYRTDIGERFYGAQVSANADLVSDAYINFGIAGPILAMVVLRLLISRRDADFFRRNREAVALFVVPYMLALFSMGLQTALLTGALAFAIILMKIADVSMVRGRFRPLQRLRFP